MAPDLMHTIGGSVVSAAIGFVISRALSRLQAKSQTTLAMLNEWHSETMQRNRAITEAIFEADKRDGKRVSRYSTIKSKTKSPVSWENFQIDSKGSIGDIDREKASHSLSMVLHYIERISDLKESGWLDSKLIEKSMGGMLRYYVREFLFDERPPCSGTGLKPLMGKLVSLEEHLERWKVRILWLSWFWD